ncbi:MAG: hypothetical protein ACRCYB_09270 [Aeromonas veronii]
MTIDWSKAPEGATHYVGGVGPSWYKVVTGAKGYYYFRDSAWCKSTNDDFYKIHSVFSPRPAEPKPYTRDEALQFLVERLDSWPTDIADAPLCPGWGWSTESRQPEFEELNPDNPEFQAFIGIDSWQVARPDFVPFVSVEDKRHEIVKEWCEPATAKQPAPSGKGDPILGMVLADLTNRALEGREKYGEALKANNGRNALWDAYQEALDLAMYLRQAIEEQHRAQTDR